MSEETDDDDCKGEGKDPIRMASIPGDTQPQAQSLRQSVEEAGQKSEEHEDKSNDVDGLTDLPGIHSEAG
jgi:hypothetical protein